MMTGDQKGLRGQERGQRGNRGQRGQRGGQIGHQRGGQTGHQRGGQTGRQTAGVSLMLPSRCCSMGTAFSSMNQSPSSSQQVGQFRMVSSKACNGQQWMQGISLSTPFSAICPVCRLGCHMVGHFIWSTHAHPQCQLHSSICAGCQRHYRLWGGKPQAAARSRRPPS